MSKIEVKIVNVEILPHENADRLSIARIGGEGGYECVVGKDQFQDGDEAIYIPPDSVLPDKILNILMERSKITIKGGRIRAIKVRGALSEGLCLSPSEWLEEKDIKKDVDLKDLLGIKKYVPLPPRNFGGGIFRSGKGINSNYQNENFHRYTDIDNFKKHPRAFRDGEEVVATVKYHGSNFRAGWVEKPAWRMATFVEKIKVLFSKKLKYEFLVGSHNKIRFAKKDAELDNDLYWRAARKYNIQEVSKKMAVDIAKDKGLNTKYNNIILYGEIVGPKIQVGYFYGVPKGDIALHIFDIKFNGDYLDWPDVAKWCDRYGLPVVNIVYQGPWSLDVVRHAEVVDAYGHEKCNREGIVVKTAIERRDLRCGRVILKCINPKYILDGRNSEWH